MTILTATHSMEWVLGISINSQSNVAFTASSTPPPSFLTLFKADLSHLKTINYTARLRLERLKIVRSTRTTVTIDLGHVSYCVSQPPDFVCASQPQPKPKRQAAAKPKRNKRKKVIKVRGRNVRRPKRPLKANQIRTIDIIDEAIEIPDAFLARKKKWVRNSFHVETGLIFLFFFSQHISNVKHVAFLFHSWDVWAR